LEARRNAIAGLEYEKGLAAFTQLHGIVSLDSVDFEFDLWLSAPILIGAVSRSYLFLRSPEQLEFSKTHMEWRTCQRACWVSARPSKVKYKYSDEPSSCSTTMTSMAPLRVAGLIEFHVLDTEPEMDRTYCIPLEVLL
jgi:hypothetical protein